MKSLKNRIKYGIKTYGKITVILLSLSIIFYAFALLSAFTGEFNIHYFGLFWLFSIFTVFSMMIHLVRDSNEKA